MRRIILSSILLFVCTVLSAQPAADTIKIISYNIWNGFEWGKDKEREAKFVEFIKNEDPNILALQELCGFTQQKLEEIAKKWGHNYAIIHKEEGYPVGITSKEPIELVKKLTQNCGHGMLHVKTYDYNLVVTHLNPFDSKKRLVEATTISDYMEQNNLATNTLLMGDLNAHSPFDATILERHNNNITQRRKSENLQNGRFDYSVISKFMSYPLIDICQKYVPEGYRETFPTLVFSAKDMAIHNRDVERIDYIMVTPDIENRVVNAYISNRGAADYLSDHYPVFVELIK